MTQHNLHFKLRLIHIAVIAILFALFNLAIHWPGQLTPDSNRQLIEATSGNYRDWHPPVMAAIWRQILFFGSSTAPMLILQISLHWLGIGLIAALLCHEKFHKAALVMLVSGFTPIAFKYTGIIQKDSLLTSFMIAGFGFASIGNISSRCGGLLLGFAGMLSRANGVFALPPLLFLIFRRSWKLPKDILFCIALSLSMIPASQWINHSLFHAERSGVERSLQLYDLAGIAYYSKDNKVLPVYVNDLERCYTPLFWDTLTSERCENAFRRVDRNITEDWIRGIVNYPTAYAQHRISHFNRELFFLVPPVQQCVEAPEFHSCPKSFISDAIEKNGFLWPIAWLVLGLVMLFSGLTSVAQALCLSGLLYGFGYLLVGVAADFRYFYWTEFAIQTALIFQIAFSGFKHWRLAAVAILFVWIVGYVWRIITVFS